MNNIELFAGCGGMSLGLKYSGYELLLANELSPMAAETFAYNFLEHTLEELPPIGQKHPSVYWLNSQYTDFKLRLRENPLMFPDLDEINNSDIPDEPLELKGKLIVGNIIHLNRLLKEKPELLESIRYGFSGEGVDLVSGGPPCQSFSLAGLRRRDCEKNTLPWEFANFVEMVCSKFVILENVSGILRAFKQEGESFHAWYEVAKVFAEKGYIPLCLHINARMIGVPQNRPRFIMIGVRNDIYKELLKTMSVVEKELFTHGEKLYFDIKAGKEVKLCDFIFFDAHREKHLMLFETSFLKHLVGKKEVTVDEAIGDLQQNICGGQKTKFVRDLNDTFSNILKKHSTITNHELRNHGLHVRRRFRIYQILQQTNKSSANEVMDILKLKAEGLSDSAWKELKKFEYLLNEDHYGKFTSKLELVNYLKIHSTKKRSQKSLVKSSPAPASLSIPDDACHYGERELRTLSIREMARIQSFPDDFVFKSKITTGGKNRRFEVPQYTQVGNAVPPLLGIALGKIIKDLLDRIHK